MIVGNFKYEAGSILDDLVSRYPHLASCKNEISDAIELLVECYRSGGKLLVCGNGGSAADSEHIVGELMKSFMRPREVDEDFAQAYFERFSTAPPAWLEGALPSLSSLVSRRPRYQPRLAMMNVRKAILPNKYMAMGGRTRPLCCAYQLQETRKT